MPIADDTHASRPTAHILVHGRVQGVGFRAWVQHQAELRGLKGWVRNRRDGTVEALVSGPAEAVEAMLRVCRRGPKGAFVARMELLPGGDAQEAPFDSFRILETV